MSGAHNHVVPVKEKIVNATVNTRLRIDNLRETKSLRRKVLVLYKLYYIVLEA